MLGDFPKATQQLWWAEGAFSLQSGISPTELTQALQSVVPRKMNFRTGDLWYKLRDLAQLLGFLFLFILVKDS